MILTKKALPRRTFLRGMGAAIALPLLDAMVPSMTAWAKTAAKPVRRLGFVYVPMGSDITRWTPPGASGARDWDGGRACWTGCATTSPGSRASRAPATG